MKRKAIAITLMVVGTLLIIAGFFATTIISQGRESYWWSVPWGNQTTCGGVEGTTWEQVHHHSWAGEKPLYLGFYLTGPHTYGGNALYKVTSVARPGIRWYIWDQPGGTDIREQWIVIPVNQPSVPVWLDSQSKSIDITYTIEVYPLIKGTYRANHPMAAQYSDGVWENPVIGSADYICDVDHFPYAVWLPTIFR